MKLGLWLGLGALAASVAAPADVRTVEVPRTHYFICTVRSVGLPAVTVIFCGALFSDSCQMRSS